MTQLEKKPHRLPRRSGQERPKLELVRSGGERHSHVPSDPPTIGSLRPDLSFQVESFAKIAAELPPLFQHHWEELALDRDAIPLDPDWEKFLALEAMGRLHVTTARSGVVLVGYIFNIIGGHLHYKSTVFADIDMFWLEPAYRGGWSVIRWFAENQRMLDRLGVKKSHVGIKNHYLAGRVGSIFRRLGYKPIETVWGR